MRRLSVLLFSLICFVFMFTAVLKISAQTPRTVTLTWEDTSNPAGTTYKVYKSSNPAAPTPTFTVIAQGVTSKTHVDAGVAPGLYRYYVTAVYNNSESIPSPTADADVKPFRPLSFRAVTSVDVEIP